VTGMIHPTNQTSEIIPKQILQNILKHRCNVIANPQYGKTNLCQVILAEFIRQRFPCQIRVYDPCSVWRHKFLSSFKLQEINDQTYQVYDGQDNIIFDIEYIDAEKITQFIGNDILLGFERNRVRKKSTNNGKLNDYIIHCIEETHGSFGRYTLSRKDGRTWLKLIGEGGNFGLSFLLVDQRLADVSASLVERSSLYLIGKLTGDNNIKKIQRVLGKDTVDKSGQPLSEKVKTLELGQFLFYDGKEAQLFNCPLFEELYPNQKPQLIREPQRRWFKIF